MHTPKRSFAHYRGIIRNVFQFQPLAVELMKFLLNVNSSYQPLMIDFIIEKLGRLGLEPRTKALKGPCSTN